MSAVDSLPPEMRQIITNLANDAYDSAYRDALDAAALLVVAARGDTKAALAAINDLKRSGPGSDVA